MMEKPTESRLLAHITNPVGRNDLSKVSINPEKIQLVEAHGTGTKLGDPIEVEALSEAFRRFTKKENFCALGSVKSNIGHLGAAAGVSGTIKLLLALKYRKLPPTINYHTLNQHIQLQGTPFYINTECRNWYVPKGEKRRAVVSAFGLSGTNAHIVVEEYLNERHHENRPAMTLEEARPL